MPVKIFFCYAHKDIKMLNELKKHLKGLQKNGVIESWCDQNISAGTEWESEIIRQLNAAQIILLLISADFMDSDHCYGVEMKRAIERHERGEARVIPVILRPVYWQYEVFSKLQPLPTEGRAITKWSIRDEAYKDITEGIAEVIKELSVKEERTKVHQVQENPSNNISRVVKKRALLILAGGRPSADILTMRYLQPHLIVVITPPEWTHQKIYIDIAQTIPSSVIRFISGVDAYDIQTCIDACNEYFVAYPATEWDWTITTSSATKVMNLAGYEVAKEKDVPCWQVDFSHERILFLVKNAVVDTQRFFRLTVEQYVKSYGYTIDDKHSERKNPNERLKQWRDSARELVFSPDTEDILSGLRGRTIGAETFISHKLKDSALLLSLEKAGLLKVRYDGRRSDLRVGTTSPDSALFLTTDWWLILYVWQEIRNATVADDCRCNITMVNGHLRLEIDLALTYRSRLLIAEFRATGSVFGLKQYLLRLDSTANLLGGEYVSKVLIINRQSAVNSSSNRYFDEFWEEAKQRKIVIITKEDLPNIAAILKREMISPTYARF